MSSETLVQRLRGMTSKFTDFEPGKWWMAEAAAEIERLTEQRDGWHQSSQGWKEAAAANEARLESAERDKAALAAERDAARRVVGRFLTWADQKCPCHNEEPNPCPLCGASVENLEPCKAADRTLPRHLLTARAALANMEGKNDG